jgi:hypothetical protein
LRARDGEYDDRNAHAERARYVSNVTPAHRLD